MELASGIVLAMGALLVWALGLYVVSRGAARRVTVLATAAMILLAVYLLGESLAALAPNDSSWAGWLRRTWWAPSLAVPVWLVLTFALARDEELPALGGRPLWLVATLSAIGLAGGAGFGVLGLTTLLVADWNAPFGAGAARHVPAGPMLLPFQLFVLVCLVWALINLLLQWRASPSGTPLRARFAWLVVSAVIFLLGGTWLVVGSGVYLMPGLPGHVLLIAGMAIMGWNLARYGALLAGEQVLSDFLAFAATMLAVIGVYGTLVIVLAPDYAWIERALPLLLLVMATHVVVDTRGHLLDRVLYVPLVRTLRGQLRELANRVVRQPDALSALADVRETVDQIMREHASDMPADAHSRPTDVRVLVEGALRHLNDLPALSQHPLLGQLEAPWAAGTPLERAARLRNELDQAIERLRPAGARPTPGGSAIGGWLHYLVLKEAYADGRPNKQVMQRYLLSEGTFHRARRSAIDAIAADLAERTSASYLAADARPSTSSGSTRSTV
ncbi:MAG TPA: hypothetical protein VGL99_19785 [Chloroflexota bacterium]|jgi:hypothetical protein